MSATSPRTSYVRCGPPRTPDRRSRWLHALAWIRPVALATCTSLALSSCGGTAAQANQPRSGDNLNDFVRWGPQIRLDETEDVINVTPWVEVDPEGGFLVADAREAQIRLYSEDGRLRHYVGREGNGPGEFRRPVAVLRMPDRSLLAADMNGRLTQFDLDGKTVVQTVQTPLNVVFAAEFLNDRLLVLSGRVPGQADKDLIHLWDVKTNSLVRSFFPAPPHPRALDGAYAFTGNADVAVRNGIIAVLFSLSDSLYLFDSEGRSRGTMKIPYGYFRPLSTPMPAAGGPAAVQEWLKTFSTNSQIFWAADGTFLFQYYDVEKVEPLWRLARMRADGEKVFEILGSPRLLAVSPDSPVLVFNHPNSATANLWATAHLAP